MCHFFFFQCKNYVVAHKRLKNTALVGVGHQYMKTTTCPTWVCELRAARSIPPGSPLVPSCHSCFCALPYLPLCAQISGQALNLSFSSEGWNLNLKRCFSPWGWKILKNSFHIRSLRSHQRSVMSFSFGIHWSNLTCLNKLVELQWFLTHSSFNETTAKAKAQYCLCPILQTHPSQQSAPFTASNLFAAASLWTPPVSLLGVQTSLLILELVIKVCIQYEYA